MASNETHVLLKHPKSGAVWPCPAGAVEAFTALGWKKAPKDAEPTVDQPASAALTTPTPKGA